MSRSPRSVTDNIRPGDADTLRKNDDWFKANANTKVKIEGNCDERSTIEYNLALGQKRVDTAKNYLIGLGVEGKLLDTISYGKERPACTAHNEMCWAETMRRSCRQGDRGRTTGHCPEQS